MQASLIRHSAAIVCLFAWAMATGALGNWVSPVLRDRKLLWLLLAASVIGAFLGSWLSVLALKYTHTVIAVTLNSTSPLFVMPLAALMLKEKISLRSVLGATLAVAGIGLYFIGEQ